MNQRIVLNDTVQLRSPKLGKVPVGTVLTNMWTAHNSLGRSRHLPVLSGCTEDIREVGLGTLVSLMVINIRILIFGQSVRSLTGIYFADSFCQSICSLSSQFGIIFIGVAILRSTLLRLAQVV